MSDIAIRQQVEKGYMGQEPLATNFAKELQDNVDIGVEFFNYYDKNKDGNIDESEFINQCIRQNWPTNNKQEAKNLFHAIKDSDGSLSAERYGALKNVRSTGDGLKTTLMDGYINDFLKQVAQNGPNTLFKDGLTLGQKIDLVQYGEIKYATSEQIDKGILKLIKKDEAK